MKEKDRDVRAADEVEIVDILQGRLDSGVSDKDENL